MIGSFTKAFYESWIVASWIMDRNLVTPARVSSLGTLSKLTRRPRGGGQQANFHSEGLKAKLIHSATDINHSRLNGDLNVTASSRPPRQFAKGLYYLEVRYS